MGSRTRLVIALPAMNGWNAASMKWVVQAAALLVALATGSAFAGTIEELRSAAERGHVDAQLDLARAYYHGEEVPRDYAEAIRWLTLAAKRGIFEAQVVVAFAHLTENFLTLDPLDDLDAGIVPRSIAPADLVAAYAWLTVAAAQPADAAVQHGLFFDEPIPHADAREGRDLLEEVMTVEQIAEGQRMARDLWEQAGHPFDTSNAIAVPSLRSPTPAPLPETMTKLGLKRGYFTYHDGSTYEGEFRDGKVHGRGIYTWSDGTSGDSRRKGWVPMYSVDHSHTGRGDSEEAVHHRSERDGT